MGCFCVYMNLSVIRRERSKTVPHCNNLIKLLRATRRERSETVPHYNNAIKLLWATRMERFAGRIRKKVNIGKRRRPKDRSLRMR